MNAVVSYYSKTGHSKKIAGAIANQLKIPMTDLRNELPLNNEEALDILFILGGLYGGKSAPEMLEAVRRIQAVGCQTSRVDDFVHESRGSPG